MSWDEDQAWESEWWGDCLNTFGEEAKQITYAHRMGLINIATDGRWPVYDLAGKSIVDIGGGPASMLLKCINRGTCVVVDPLLTPSWVGSRYREAGIEKWSIPAERFNYEGWRFDETWIYNCLQHVQDPRVILANAVVSAPVVRIFEWIDMGVSIGHPHSLTAEMFTAELGEGTVEQLDGENGCTGRAFYGVFTR